MDSSIDSTVGVAVALQQFNANQGAQMSLLKQALDGQASQVAQLLEAAPAEPQLADFGSRGTQLNTYA